MPTFPRAIRAAEDRAYWQARRPHLYRPYAVEASHAEAGSLRLLAFVLSL